MSRLLEILGKAITIDVADLIWHWFEAVRPYDSESKRLQYKELYEIAELAGHMKNNEAEKRLKFYLYENPSCARGHLAMAAINLQNNLLQNALDELKIAYSYQPHNTTILYALGHLYERTGEENIAIEFYQDCIKFKNYLQLPRQRLAAIYFKNRQLEKAISEYESLKKEYPADIGSLVMLGYLYMADGKNEQAIETFNTAILTHPDNFQNTDLEIDELVQSSQHHQALEKLEQDLLENPERPEILLKYGDILNMLEMPTEAIEKYEEAVRICPNFLEATIKLGTQYLHMHREKDAAIQFNQAFELNDQIVDAYIGLSMAQKMSGKNEAGLDTLSLAAAIQPNSSLLFVETANILFKAALDMEDIDNSNLNSNLFNLIIDVHQNQIHSLPNHPDLHYRLGLLFMNIKNYQFASKCFLNSLEINPFFNRARTKLVICLYEMGKKTNAYEQLPSVICPDKDTLDLHYQTSLLYCDRIKFASSILNLQRNIENNFSDDNTTANISIVLQNLGLLDRVMVMWDNLVETSKTISKAPKT